MLLLFMDAGGTKGTLSWQEVDFYFFFKSENRPRVASGSALVNIINSDDRLFSIILGNFVTLPLCLGDSKLK